MKNVELMLSLAAFAVSVAAATFAWKQVDVAQVHNRVSVLPLLRLTPHAEGKGGRNGIYLSNAGLGPAVIRRFTAKSGNAAASGFAADHWPEILLAAGVNPLCFSTAWPTERSAVKAGDELPLVYITKAEGMDVCYQEVVKLMAGTGVQVSVEYESFYREVLQESSSSKVNSATLQFLYKVIGGK